MSKSIHFNSGTLSISHDQASWILSDSKVRCVSLGELDYLMQEQDFAVPLIDIEHKDKMLHFTWKVTEDIQPLEKKCNERTWFKLKIAKSLLQVAEHFIKNENLQTIFERENIFVDINHNVKVLFYTNPIHLPCQSDPKEDFTRVKRLLAMLFSSIHQEEIEKLSLNDIIQKSSKEEQEFIGKLMKAEDLTNLKQIVHEEYNRSLAQKDNSELILQENTKIKKKNKLIIFASLILFVSLSLGYLLLGNSNKLQEEVGELEALTQTQDKALDQLNEEYKNHLNTYQAYYDGEIEEALKYAKKLKDASSSLDNAFYIQLLVQNGDIQEAIDQYPKQINNILNKLIELDSQEEITKLDGEDNVYIQFEQAVIVNDDEKLMSIIEALEDPTDRQKKIIFEVYLRNNSELAYEYAEKNKKDDWKAQVLEAKVEGIKKNISKLDKKKDAKKIKPLEEEVKGLTKEINELKKS